MRGVRSTGSRQGMVLWIVIIVVAFSAMIVYNLTMLSQGEIRLLGRTEWLVRCEIASRSVYQDITQELRIKPWEKRSFKSGAKTKNGSYPDGVRWQALIEDAPDKDNCADIWIRTDLFEAKRVVFYRVEVNYSLFQKMNEIEPTFVAFLDAERYGNSGTRTAIRDHVDEVLKLRAGKVEERRRLAKHIQNQMNFGSMMSELGLPVIGDVPVLQTPLMPGATSGYTMPPLDMVFNDVPEDPLLTHGGLSVDSFQVVSTTAPLADELVEKLKKQLGEDKAIRVLDAIQRIRIGLPPGDNLIASDDADLGGGELEGGVIRAMLRAIKGKQKEIVKNARMMEMMKRLAAMQARADQILAKLAAAMKGEKGIDVNALKAQLAKLQDVDITENIGADDLMDNLDYTTESGDKIDIGGMEMDTDLRNEIEEKIADVNAAVEAPAAPAEAAPAGDNGNQDSGKQQFSEVEQQVQAQVKNMDGIYDNAKGLAGQLSVFQKTDESGSPFIDFSGADPEAISGLKNNWSELMTSRETFDQGFSDWREQVQANTAGEKVALVMTDWAKDVFDSDFSNIAGSASDFFNNYDGYLAGLNTTTDSLPVGDSGVLSDGGSVISSPVGDSPVVDSPGGSVDYSNPGPASSPDPSPSPDPTPAPEPSPSPDPPSSPDPPPSSPDPPPSSSGGGE